MILPLLVFQDWGLLVLRLVVAAIFWAHGWPKLKDLKVFQSNFEMMGFKPGWLWGTIVSVLEPVGSLLMIAGFLVQPVALLLVVQMLVAANWKRKMGKGLVDGYELDLLLVAANLVLATAGAGAFSVDSYFRLF